MSEETQGCDGLSTSACAPVLSNHLTGALSTLGLTSPRPVLVLVGGAANIDPAVADGLLVLFERLAPRLDALGVTLVDGGTAFGVMALMGRARRQTGARFPLVGVAARGTVALATLPSQALSSVLTGLKPNQQWSAPAASGEAAQLDQNHSHFLLVPGEHWGDESEWIMATAACLAAGHPFLTLVAGGGRITRLDVTLALKAGLGVVVLAGTGGVADLLAGWWRHGWEIPDVSLSVKEHALIQVVELVDAIERLPDILTQTFASFAE